jgi:hypothetical protein
MISLRKGPSGGSRAALVEGAIDEDRVAQLGERPGT